MCSLPPPPFPPHYYLGEQANDLPFVYGEILTIIEPCSVVYWYLAENSKGRRGIIPITYVQVILMYYNLLKVHMVLSAIQKHNLCLEWNLRDKCSFVLNILTEWLHTSPQIPHLVIYFSTNPYTSPQIPHLVVYFSTNPTSVLHKFSTNPTCGLQGFVIILGLLHRVLWVSYLV